MKKQWGQKQDASKMLDPPMSEALVILPSENWLQKKLETTYNLERAENSTETIYKKNLP